MPVVPALYQDPFSPVLRSSETLVLSPEQKFYVREILDIACSDSRFAEKAYNAIQFVLTGGSVVTPVVTGLNPGSATLGDPSFTLHVMGTGFGVESQIVWNGSAEPTTFVSATELTTGVDMATAEVAMSIPVAVVTGLGVLSNQMLFVLQPLAARSVKKTEEPKRGTDIKKEEGAK